MFCAFKTVILQIKEAFSVLRNHLFYFHFEKTIMEPPETRILRTGAVLLCKQLQQVLCLTRRRYTWQAVKWKCFLSFLKRRFHNTKFWDKLKSDPALMDPTKSISSRIWSFPRCFVIFHGCGCFSMRFTMVQSCKFIVNIQILTQLCDALPTNYFHFW